MVERAGVTVFERTEVIDWAAVRVRFRVVDDGRRGHRSPREHVIIATEGYGARGRGCDAASCRSTRS